MTWNSPETDCPVTDEVLARFLDGDTEGREREVAEDLSLHVAECVVCRMSLRDARRLDAILAQTSVPEVSTAQADQLLTAVLRVPEPMPSRPWPVALAVAATLVVGVGLGAWLWPQFATEDLSDIPVRSTTIVVEVPAREFDFIPLPDASSRPLPSRRTERVRLSPREVLVREDLSEALLPGAVFAQGILNLAAPGVFDWRGTWVRAEHHAARGADEVRFEAGLALLDSGGAEDLQVLVDFLGAEASGDGGTARLRTDLIDACRSSSQLADRLVRRLRSSRLARADVVAAARLGGVRLDRALLDLGRDEQTMVTQIATAASSVSQRPGRVSLLLDLWTVLDSRSELSEDQLEMFASWFRGLPAHSTAEVVAIARDSRQLRRRLQCLRVLAWQRNPDALLFLLEQVEGNQHDLALAAGFALSRLPRNQEMELADRVATSRRPYVLQAALCGSGSEFAVASVRAAELSREEAQFLLAGPFSNSQFAIAAQLCRRRQITF